LASIASNESDQPFGCRLPLGSPLSPRPAGAPGGRGPTSSFLPFPVVAVRAAGRLARGRPAALCFPVSPQSSGKMGRAAKQPKARTRGAKGLVATRVGWSGCARLQVQARQPTAPRPPAILTTVGADSLIVSCVEAVTRCGTAECPRANPRRELDLDSFVRAVPHLGEVVDDPTGSPGIVRQVRPGVVLELMVGVVLVVGRDHSVLPHSSITSSGPSTKA